MNPEQDLISISSETLPFDIQAPQLTDAAGIDELVRDCPPLDPNSRYLYLLLCYHHATTCAVARNRENGRLVGFLSTYRVPESPDTIFVWQIAVHADARGHGLAGRMIEDVLQREHCRDIQFIEATVSPSNKASARVFERLAERLGGRFERKPLFEQLHFGGAEHEAEDLIRVGPFHLS